MLPFCFYKSDSRTGVVEVQGETNRIHAAAISPRMITRAIVK